MSLAINTFLLPEVYRKLPMSEIAADGNGDRSRVFGDEMLAAHWLSAKFFLFRRIVLSSDIAQARQSAQAQQLVEEVGRLKQQLIASQRNSALGELASTTAHEFNNILMTIMNYARMGLRNPDPAAREKAFNRILSATERATAITGSMLGVSRNKVDKFETVSLKETVQGVMVLLEKEMQKYRIQVETEFDDAPDVPINGGQIQQVLMNLMINSRQAMPGGGRLLVKIKHDPAAGRVDLIVRDFGSGIPADKLPFIFEAGYSTKSGPDETGRGGAGLGLAACRAIIEAHQGKVRVESSPGKGTAFTIRLPIHRTGDITPSAGLTAVPAIPDMNQPMV